ncbi:influenza virus NS1A-binding protein-like [Physella acuta]|uniref:influenza virus NS1A-binding protein-like n=1 Tax=Physella acuta TaxID=109671 RepID=UPI0027DCC7DB|nr:influenza virus NS1A-binding protein-like [Physella acuta]
MSTAEQTSMTSPEITAARILVENVAKNVEENTSPNDVRFSKGSDSMIERRLYVVSRTGSGEVSYLLLTENFSAIVSYRVHIEKWQQTYGVADFGVVALGKSIYILGGFDKVQGRCLTRVVRYNPCTDEWFECRSMSVARCKFGVCVVKGRIFVCGGETDDGKVTGSCEIYDPETNLWSKCGSLVSPRSGCACANNGKELICAGGYNGGKAHNNLWLYDKHKWQEIGKNNPHGLPYNLHRCALTRAKKPFVFYRR